MKIKLWQKFLFFGSIGGLIIFLQRDKIKKAYNKVYDYMFSFADRWKGTLEIGNNRAFADKVFEGMLRNIGWRPNSEWCMYFAKAVHFEAFPNDRANIQKILGGNSNNSYDRAEKDRTGTYTVSKTPQIGDIAIWKIPSQQKGHAGLVKKVNSDGTMVTIEGNIDDRTSREETVADKVRTTKIDSVLQRGSSKKLRGFIRKIV
jgi:surface antigen